MEGQIAQLPRCEGRHKCRSYMLNQICRGAIIAPYSAPLNAVAHSTMDDAAILSYNFLRREIGFMADKKNTIGRFEIIEKIGEGPIGAVYKALDPVIRRTVAIKVIKLYALEETTTFAEVFEKIYRVVRTSTSLNHPNICIIYDLSEEKKIPYITMEFVEGHDVESLLKQKHQFKRAELLNILQQTCDALDFAHKKNVIHQDLKSTNLLITPDLHVKITDFGIAGLDEIAAAQTKKLLSIPFYISPEQALGERVSPASDLFSLGVVIYHLLSGQLPFPGTTAANTIMMIARDTPSVPADLNRSAISREDWNSFFSIALAKSPNQRFRSAREMLEALNSILPASDQTYYPFGFEGELNDSTGKFEKTYIADADIEPASPTLMIDASQILEENASQSRSITNTTQESHPIIDYGTAELEIEDQPITAPVNLEEPIGSEPVTELGLALDEGLKEAEKAEKTQEPVPVEKIFESPKRELLELPFNTPVEESHPQESLYKTIPPAIEPSLPADFIPAPGNIFDIDEVDQDNLATIAPTPIEKLIADQASDTSPVNLGKASEITAPHEPPPPVPEPVVEPEPEPELELLEEESPSAPTQLFAQPKLDPSKGNGRAVDSIEEAAATIMGAFAAPNPEVPPSPATVLVTPPPKPREIPQPVEQEYFQAPTKIMDDVRFTPSPTPAPPPVVSAVTSSRAQTTEPVPMPPTPPPPKPITPPKAPYTTVKPVEPKSAAGGKPPAMQRYIYAAIALVIFIALVGGGILLFRKPTPTPGPTPTPTGPVVINHTNPPTPQQQPGPVTQTPTNGTVMVTSEPTGATVFLEGVEKGVTPVEIPEIAFGKHMVKLQLKGYQDIEKEVELTPETPTANMPLTMEKVAILTGTINVESQPDGAFIVIANRVMGVTPKMFSRKPGKYDITLKKDGFQDYTGSVTVLQDKKVTFHGNLAEIPKPVPVVVQPPAPKAPEVTKGQLVTLGPDVIPPKPVKKVYAKYPDTAKAKKLEGTVRLNVLVDETGHVIDIKITKSAHPLLDDAVTKAYQQWTFQPATKQGIPVKVWISVAMSFQSGR
jgi:TonB family protein